MRGLVLGIGARGNIAESAGHCCGTIVTGVAAGTLGATGRAAAALEAQRLASDVQL